MSFRTYINITGAIKVGVQGLDLQTLASISVSGTVVPYCTTVASDCHLRSINSSLQVQCWYHQSVARAPIAQHLDA